jgi:hypothetical protein
MIIDQSPMSAFLTWALYIVGIPAIILSIIVAIKVMRSFFGDRDYNLENPEHKASQGTAQAATTHEDKPGGDSTVHSSNASRDTMNARMIQSG